jgi:hypothetical protein
MKTFILVAVEHRKPVPDLTDAVAARAYTMDGVTNANAIDLTAGKVSVQQLLAFLAGTDTQA